MTQPEILTFGCRLNTWESEVMREHAAALDDVIIVNTCAVTGEAERQARQAIRRAHRDKPNARIVVTGCAAQIDPDRWAGLPGVTRVLGNEEKLKAESWSPAAMNEARAVSDIMAAKETAAHLVTEFSGRTRAFVQVQQGCDHRCTFCIIPFGRGPSRSAPVGVVVEQVRALVESGYREVVLTGVDMTSWGETFRVHLPWGSCAAGCWRSCRSLSACACPPWTRWKLTRISGDCWSMNPASCRICTCPCRRVRT